jgi:hypothetical protein
VSFGQELIAVSHSRSRGINKTRSRTPPDGPVAASLMDRSSLPDGPVSDAAGAERVDVAQLNSFQPTKMIYVRQQEQSMAAPLYHYFYSGLEVASEIPIPEWERFVQRQACVGPQIVMRRGALLEGADVDSAGKAITGVGHHRFLVQDVALYEVNDGSEILVRPLAGAAESDIRLYLLGSAWGAVCYQRGIFVLHGSAIGVGSAAVAFCAHSGMGKSTTAAWFARRGFPLLSDDLCRVDISSHGKPMLYPSVQRLKLWSESLGALGLDSHELPRDRTRFDKFHVQWPTTQCDPLPLHAIYLLNWGELSIRRLTGRVALQRFLSAATYRGSLLEPMGQWNNYCAQSIQMLQRVPAWEFNRSRDFAAMEDAADSLEAHWKETGLEFSVPGLS